MGQTESSLAVDELCVACEKGDEATVKRLLGEGRVGVNARRGDAGWTPLHFACEANQLAVAQVLLESGADVGVVTSDWQASPLHLALSGNPKAVLMVALLLRSGADPNAKNRDGVSPLMLAVDLNDKLSVRALVKCGAETDGQDRTRLMGDEEMEIVIDGDGVPLLHRSRAPDSIDDALRSLNSGVREKTQLEQGQENANMTAGDIALACEALRAVDISKLDSRALAKLNSFYANQLQQTITELKKRNNPVDLLMEDDD